MADSEDSCNGTPADTTHFGLRVGSIFIILAASLLGALTPILLGRCSHGWHNLFFAFKFVGSGVILATAWMHLLAPAVEELGDPCLEDRLGEYDWAFFIGLATVLTMFLAEILATHYGDKVAARAGTANRGLEAVDDGDNDVSSDGRGGHASHSGDCVPVRGSHDHYPPVAFDDAHNHNRGKSRNGDTETPLKSSDSLDSGPSPNLAGQLTAVLILEFGVVFHSVFIGLVLATTDDLVVLLIVLVFHQFMEGLGLGSRLAAAPWPRKRSWLPYVLALGFGVSTPVGIAAGLGAKPTSAANQNLTNGIFDAISSGILMYTGLVELLAHEFLLDPAMRSSGLGKRLGAYVCVLFGAGIMALLAKWA